MNTSVAAAFIESDEPLLDNNQVEMLRETALECEPELLQELLDLYCQDNTARVERIRPAIARGDWAEAAKLAHAVAGSSSNMGGNRISKLSILLENNINDGSLADLDAIAEQIEIEFALTIEAFRELLIPS